jgi:hypothetical protein
MSQKPTNEMNPLDPQQWTEAPAEFAEGTGDLVGYWESASPPTAKRHHPLYGSPPVTFTPLYVTLTDSDADETKTSTLIHCRLEAPCLLRSAVKDEGYVEFPVGSLFGVWAKPGLKELKRRANQKIWLRNGQLQRGEVVYFKEIGQQSPMVIYTIRWAADAKTEALTVREDHRKESLDDAAIQRRQRRAARVAEKAEALEGGDDFIPF